MSQVLIGAAIALFTALFTGWVAERWKAQQAAKTIAVAILAEMEAGRDLDVEGGVQRLYRGLLASGEEYGVIGNPQLIRTLFEFQPGEASPVYHAALTNIGALPSTLAKTLIEFKAVELGLVRSVARFFGHDHDLDEDAIRALCREFTKQYDLVLEKRDAAIDALRGFLNLSPAPAGLRVTPTPQPQLDGDRQDPQ